MKTWRPHLELTRLSAALGAEIVDAPEQELRGLSAESGYSLAAAAREVRELLETASGEADAGDVGRAPARLPIGLS